MAPHPYLTLVGIAGSYASLLALVLTLPSAQTLNRNQQVLIAVATVCVLLAVSLVVWTSLRARPRVLKNSKEIRDYLYNWISHEGGVVIFTHDLTWVSESDSAMQGLLQEKSRRNELHICLPKR